MASTLRAFLIELHIENQRFVRLDCVDSVLENKLPKSGNGASKVCSFATRENPTKQSALLFQISEKCENQRENVSYVAPFHSGSVIFLEHFTKK